MMDPRAMEERKAVADRANFEPVELMNGRDAELLHEMLMTLFKEHDADGNGSLDAQEFEACRHVERVFLHPSEGQSAPSQP